MTRHVGIARIGAAHRFPDPLVDDVDDLVGVGGDLHPDRVLVAYRSGIFPWYSEGRPILWHCPDPRFVLDPLQVTVPRSLAKVVRKATFEIRVDTSFSAVLDGCAHTPRPRQRGTWLTTDLRQAMVALFDRGVAHSIEAWHEGALVGGLYGLHIGGVFCGESMFAKVSDASKVAFTHFLGVAPSWGIRLVDCQVHTEHLARFGAVHVPRASFLRALAALRDLPVPPNAWRTNPLPPPSWPIPPHS